MADSVFYGRNMFRDHCDFILLIYLPFFYLIQKTETLLAIQSFSIALAGIPLFFLCKKVLNSISIALLVVMLFFLYPANHCALFYDIHELSFLPLGVFSLFYFLKIKNVYGLLGAIILLLSIKLDIFVFLVPISIFIYLNNKKDLKFSAFALSGSVLYGIIYVLFLKKWLSTDHLFYFNNFRTLDVATLGPGTFLKTAITNPVFVLKTMFAKDRIFFLFQMFGPLAFVPLMRFKNLLLFLYGLAFAFLVDGSSKDTIYFQYVWYIVPALFIGLIYTLKEMQDKETNSKIWTQILKNNIRPVLVVILFSSFIYSWQYGAIFNKKLFIGGFHKINFNLSVETRKRLQALDSMIALIPPDAQVSAPDELTAHFTNHGNLHRLENPDTEQADYLLLFAPRTGRPDYSTELITDGNYEIIDRNSEFQLFKKISQGN